MNHPSRKGTAAVRRDRRAGFTIVEVIVAMLILVIGILGLAGATGQIIRQITFADLESERAVAFQTVVDQMQSLPYASVVDGNATIGVFDVRWTVVNSGSQSKIVTITTVGPGVSATSTTNDPVRIETFDFRVLRR